MITVRKSSDRGHLDHGWLDTYHTFSFGDYYDPGQMHFRTLRVINEDRVAPGYGFPTHPHRDMEIITYVLSGELEHADSLGNGSRIRPGEAQRMTAGSGVTHSEKNPSPTEPVHLLQIWLFPERKGLEPSYDQRVFFAQPSDTGWKQLVSHDGRDGSMTVHQDVNLYAGRLRKGEQITQPLGSGRYGWLQVARGSVMLDGIALAAGDAAAVSDHPELHLTASEDAEVLLFDLA